MKFYKILALIGVILIATFSCKKEEVSTDYSEKLFGYYVGTIEHLDTLVDDNRTIPMKYASRLSAFVQKNKDSALEVAYSTNINYYYTGTVFTGNAETQGIINDITLTKENLFFINETTVDFWGKPISIKGNGIYDETNHNLTFNLEANDNGKINKFQLTLVRQKRLD